MLIRFKGRAQCLLLMVVLLNCDLRGAIAQNSAARPSASETEADSQRQTLLLSSAIAAAVEKSRWSFSFESIYTFEDIPNPWFIAFMHPTKKNFRDYKFATEILSTRYRVTDTSGPLFLRGNLELSIGPIATAIVNGPESYFAGALTGFRYNFVQPRARLIPYFELRGALGLSDSKKRYKTLQSDATFSYLIGTGLRYQINPRWSFDVGAVDQHLSTGFFASRDYGVDSLGINVGIELRY
jgi:hypothetical protein